MTSEINDSAKKIVQRSAKAERKLIEREAAAERAVLKATERLSRAADKLAKAEARVERRRTELANATAELGRRQSDRATGPRVNDGELTEAENPLAEPAIGPVDSASQRRARADKTGIA